MHLKSLAMLLCLSSSCAAQQKIRVPVCILDQGAMFCDGAKTDPGSKRYVCLELNDYDKLMKGCSK